MHPSAELAADAVAPPGARVVTRAKLEELKAAVRTVAVAVAAAGEPTRTEALGEQLHHARLLAGEMAKGFAVPPRARRRQRRR